MISYTHCAQIFLCFNLRGKRLAYNLTNLPNLLIRFSSFSKRSKGNLDYHIPLLQIMTFSTRNFDHKKPYWTPIKKNHFSHVAQVVFDVIDLTGVFFTSWVVGYLTSQTSQQKF